MALLPWLIAMAVLMIGSAFFSASEAAFFSLRAPDRRVLRAGSSAGRIADGLLEDSDRLLSAVLFWNLVINMVYFALASQVALRLATEPRYRSVAFAFSLAALLALIVLSEMLPKTLAVLVAKRVAVVLAIPIAFAVRFVDPLMPLLRGATEFSRRLVWPRFQAEAYLRIEDLERAIEYSTADARLIEQERTSLRNLVKLSEIRVDEWMRPRTLFRSFRPPVSLEDLRGELPPSGYLLVTARKSEEVVAAINLKELYHVPDHHLEQLADPVVVVPWCATVADAFDEMRSERRSVAAVVNEYGETIGILTFDDLLDTIFRAADDRSERLWNRSLIKPIRPGAWLVTGLTSLRQLAAGLGVELPPMKSATVTGCIWEQLHRIAREGDEVDCGPLHFRVLEAPAHGLLLAELTLSREESAS